MGDVNLKIVPEASVFRGDADFEGPGAQKYHFWRFLRFWNMMFKHMSRFFFSGNVFSKQMSKNDFPENGGWGQLWFWCRARKITPLIYPLILKNFFGHETGRRGSCGAVEVLVFLEISSRGPF